MMLSIVLTVQRRCAAFSGFEDLYWVKRKHASYIQFKQNKRFARVRLRLMKTYGA